MIQMRSTPPLAAAAFGPVASAPVLGIAGLPGVEFDAAFSPVPIPPKSAAGDADTTAAFAAPGLSTYVVRATIQTDALPDLLKQANSDPNIVGVFADPRIQPIAACPNGPVGTALDVERLLLVEELRRRGLDGTGVKVVIVDTGVNMN
jgi:hypothetical protein